VTPRTSPFAGPYSDAAELERRPERHGGVSHLVAVNGTLVAATHPGFLAAAAREIAAALGLRQAS
jgi:hypothetical protein